ncbi:hypothetical protein [Haloprofundus salilacus]|uniref:hypothetical protein n=1 Tax=Haloprofundus salilacus TaxID=2876190 RepID=UPI001CCE310D|nr:hypothetical protein [Haloprofundus salilacus]
MAESLVLTKAVRNRYVAFKRQLFTFVFGDRYGLLLFVSALSFFGLYWRVGIFLNDNYAVANGLYNAANGHLQVTEIIYGPSSGSVPGMVSGENGRYSRNVGQIVITLPVLWILKGFALVADLRVLLLGVWCSLILAMGMLLSRIFNEKSYIQPLAAIVALTVFGLNLSVATELESRWLAPLALQLTSMAAAALSSVIIYRLLSRLHTTHVGLIGGVIVAIATPVGFWASIPKRHTYMALLVVATVYSFYRSREATESAKILKFRALSYAFVGLATWIQAGEAFVLFVSLVTVDFATAPSNSRRELRTIGGVFGLSLVPFLLTNLIIAGNPLMPPMLLPRYTETAAVTTGSSGTSSSNSSTVSVPIWLQGVALLEATSLKAIEQMNRFTSILSKGVTVLSDPERLTQVFIRGGYIEDVASRDHGQAVNLALLEAMPLFGAIVILPKTLVKRIRTQNREPIAAVDWLVAVYVVLLTIFYLPRLPVHAMITVRYLLPIMPLLVYAVFRFAAFRELLQYPRVLGFSYAGTVLIGSQLILVLLVVLQANLGEAAQVHAWINLAAATCLIAWLLLYSYVPQRFQPVGAVVLGCVCGLTTAFLLLSGVVYFSTGSGFVLPAIEWLSTRLNWM